MSLLQATGIALLKHTNHGQIFILIGKLVKELMLHKEPYFMLDAMRDLQLKALTGGRSATALY